MPEATALPASYRCALVTGATSGIGKAIVLALRDAGLQVIAVGRSREALQALGQEQGVVTVEADVRQADAFAQVLSQYPVDVLVNNAGVLSSRAAFQSAATHWFWSRLGLGGVHPASSTSPASM